MLINLVHWIEAGHTEKGLMVRRTRIAVVNFAPWHFMDSFFFLKGVWRQLSVLLN